MSKYDNLLAGIYNNVTIAIIVNTIIVAIYEGQHMIRNWLHSLIEVEKLRREKAESQYSALRNQVNPHFLFNSLNSLSSLIRISPDRAIEFVDKFSKIYRYVLDVNDKILVELKQELDFLQSYYFLQKIRFGNNLVVEVNIDANKLNDFILPLSLQIVIENAIKHNEISSVKPLRISVFVEEEFLVISNNLQKKEVLEHSTGIGIANLQERYKHFTDLEPEFFIKGQNYYAKIPIIHEKD
jgi:LytS/YehU family sensor histidine kinase